ncbi:hypothetical protein INR49_026218 [Caranx melampygus]|nr:hypothetical protein INR49_026218 [Caranx melampygus]
MQNRCAVPNCSIANPTLSHSSGFRVIQKEAQCKVLKDDAMPTIFDVPNHLKMDRPKMMKQRVEGEKR